MSISELNGADRFARENGVQLVEECQASGTSGAAMAEMTVEERHLNGANVCQGGALFTLADLAAAGVTRGEALTASSEIQFLHPARLGDHLTAEARLVNGGRMPLVETEVRNQEGRLLVKVSARFVKV